MVIPISWKNKRHNFSRTNLLVFHRDLLVRSTLGSNKSGHRSTPITTKSPAHVACLASDQEIVQQHSPWDALFDPLLRWGALLWPLLKLFFWLVMIGLTDTFTGVGCVKKFGISHDSMVLVAGLRIPLPMQINRILSTDGAVGPISSGHFDCNALVMDPTVSDRGHSSSTWTPSLLAKMNLILILLVSFSVGALLVVSFLEVIILIVMCAS